MSNVSSNKLYNVAVVGATGVVGQRFLEVVAKRHFPLRNLRLLASKRSAGKRITFGEREIEVEETTTRSFGGVDLAFISATDEISREMAPVAPPKPARSPSTTAGCGGWTPRSRWWCPR
jgi:aspartate-semialdehyde dehydrogenase